MQGLPLTGDPDPGEAQAEAAAEPESEKEPMADKPTTDALRNRLSLGATEMASHWESL